LAPGAYLNDNVVNTYSILLQQRHPARRALDCVLLSFFYQCVKTRRIDGRTPLQILRIGGFPSEDVNALASFRRLLIPINRPGVHWVFAVVNVENKSIHHYDSGERWDRGRSVGRTECSIIAAFLNSCGAFSSRPRWSTVFEEAPQQPDGHSCGLYVLSFLESFLRLPENTVMPNINPVAFRTVVGEALLSSLPRE